MPRYSLVYEDYKEMLRYARPAALAEIIVDVDFPKVLREGTKIAGIITLRNPFTDNAYLGCVVNTVWDGVYFYSFSRVVVPPGGTLPFSFPGEFPARLPEDAPDPVMPGADAPLIIHGLAANIVTGEWRREDRRVTISLYLEWWEQPFLGVPAWVWLAGGLGTTLIGVGAFLYVRRREEEMMLLMRLRRRRV